MSIQHERRHRSRSETRKIANANGNGNGNVENGETAINLHRETQLGKLKILNQSQTHLNQMSVGMGVGGMGVGGMGMDRRKTSAELISEAKLQLGDMEGGLGGSMLNLATSVGGVRLVSTRRPITPREHGRALYGKVSLAGRPPSAFSLRYLQNEGNRSPLTPQLEPMPAPLPSPSLAPHKPPPPLLAARQDSTTLAMQQMLQRTARRSHSFDSHFEFYEIGRSSQEAAAAAAMAIPRKLPALEVQGVALEGKQKKSDVMTAVTTSPGGRGQTPRSEPRMVIGSSGTDKIITVLTTRKLSTRHRDLLAQSTTEKLIELLKEHSGLKDCTEETVKHINAILVELYNRVRNSEKNFKRGFILGGLYGLVECSSPKILLAVARVVLALHVTGSNLTGACKLIFKVARNEQNDQLFHDNDLLELLIDGLGRASPLDDPEACIYGYGSIRFLASSSGQDRPEASSVHDLNKNWSESLMAPPVPIAATATFDCQHQMRYEKLSKQNSLVERLARHGAVDLMVLHLQILNEAGATKKLSGPPLHSLYQVSAAVRALADVRQTSSSLGNGPKEEEVEENREKKQSGNLRLELACPQLVRAAEISMGELEVQANIVRTLSVLSEDDECLETLVNYSARIGMLLGPCCEIFISASDKLLALFSRLGYILGNLMAKYDDARVQFYRNDVAMEYLLKVLELYSKESLTFKNSAGDSVTDVLIKMVRVVANMSVNSEVGFGLGHTRDLGMLLLKLLSSATAITAKKSSKPVIDLLELIHASLGALHNLCFYQDRNVTPSQVMVPQGCLLSILTDLAIVLSATLKSTPDEATRVETMRVLGNLTRNDKARKCFFNADGLKVIVEYLHASGNHHHHGLATCAIGVLVNLLGDYETRSPFLHLRGAEVLLEMLEEAFKSEDWFLATIICQAFWNLLIDTPKLGEDVNLERVLDDVSDLIADYIEEERLFPENDFRDPHWEEFAMVAADLLERIQLNYEQESDDGPTEARRGERNRDGDDDCDDGNDNDNHNDEDDVYIEEM